MLTFRFLQFNDALLYLVPVMNEMIRLNEEFPLDGMEVDISNQSDREFVIRSMRRSFALMARSKDERAAWVEALEGAIAENDAKKNSFETARGHSNSCGNSSSYSSLDRRSSSPHRSASRLQDSFSSDHHHHQHHELEHSPSMSSTDEHHHHSTPEGPHHQSLHHQPSSASTTSSASIETARRNTNPNNAVSTLGERAPVWVHDYRVSMCQGCMREFTIFFRRHHCRACGSVVCSDCSTHHYPLRYRKMEPQRVCDNCYQTLSTLHPEWLNGGGGGGGGGNSGHGNGTGGTPTGSNRVSPNNSLSAADAAALKRKSRSNSCTHLDDSFNWANGPENGGSGGGGGGLHNQSLPVGGTILEQQDQNHNPTSSGSLLSPSTLVRGPIRFSSRFARKNIPAVLVEVSLVIIGLEKGFDTFFSCRCKPMTLPASSPVSCTACRQRRAGSAFGSSSRKWSCTRTAPARTWQPSSLCRCPASRWPPRRRPSKATRPPSSLSCHIPASRPSTSSRKIRRHIKGKCC